MSVLLLFIENEDDFFLRIDVFLAIMLFRGLSNFAQCWIFKFYFYFFFFIPNPGGGAYGRREPRRAGHPGVLRDRYDPREVGRRLPLLADEELRQIGLANSHRRDTPARGGQGAGARGEGGEVILCYKRRNTSEVNIARVANCNKCLGTKLTLEEVEKWGTLFFVCAVFKLY